MSAKDDIRQQVRHQRENLELTDIAEVSHEIVNKLLVAQDWSKVKTVLSYSPINGEIDPTLFENQIKSMFKDITFEHAVASPEAIIPEKQFDVILVPCLAADEGKHRLGNGGGWYDKLLAQQSGKKIGLVYDFGILPKLPVEEHDIPLDIIISPSQTIK